MDIHETERNLNNKISRGGEVQCGFLVAMPSRHWIAATVVGLALTSPVLAQDAQQEISPPEISSEAPTKANDDGDSIFAGAVPDTPEAADNTGAKKGDGQYPEDESGNAPWWWKLLLLRETPAQAVMAWASVFAAFVSLLATVLLWLTLRETRLIGQAEVRAYKLYRIGQVRSTSDGAGRLEGVSVVGKLENCGQSPAYDVELGGLLSMTCPEISEEPDRRITFALVSSYLAPGISLDAATVQIPIKNFIDNPDLAKTLWGMVVVRYRDVFKTTQYAWIRGEFCRPDGKALPFSDIREAAANNLVSWKNA
jgi:hypothetical protein